MEISNILFFLCTKACGKALMESFQFSKNFHFSKKEIKKFIIKFQSFYFALNFRFCSSFRSYLSKYFRTFLESLKVCTSHSISNPHSGFVPLIPLSWSVSWQIIQLFPFIKHCTCKSRSCCVSAARAESRWCRAINIITPQLALN